MACFRLVTFLPERPDRNVPRFISRIERRTLRLAVVPYFRPRDVVLVLVAAMTPSTAPPRRAKMSCNRRALFPRRQDALPPSAGRGSG
jgi:hypothetical protein